MDNITINIAVDLPKQRLDKFLSGAVEDLSRSRLKALIEQGCVRINETEITDPNHKVKGGDTVSIQIPDADEPDPEPENIPLEIVYEDEDLIVINKQAGLVVHPGAGNYTGTLVNALLYHCGDQLSGIGGVKRPGIVHRLDKDTSGLMVVAKNDKAHHGLSEQFSDRTLSRKYHALVWGCPKQSVGRVETQIGRSNTNRKKMATLHHGGKLAITNYKVLECYNGAAAKVECKLETGRTHQIRVHMTHLGHSLLGDPVYGTAPKVLNSTNFSDLKNYLKEHPLQALHAYQLKFTHPLSKKNLKFSINNSQLFNDLENLLEKI